MCWVCFSTNNMILVFLIRVIRVIRGSKYETLTVGACHARQL